MSYVSLTKTMRLCLQSLWIQVPGLARQDNSHHSPDYFLPEKQPYCELLSLVNTLEGGHKLSSRLSKRKIFRRQRDTWVWKLLEGKSLRPESAFWGGKAPCSLSQHICCNWVGKPGGDADVPDRGEEAGYNPKVAVRWREEEL